MSGPRSLKTLLADWNPRRGSASGAATGDEGMAACALAWERSVGGAIARRSRPLKLNNGVLTVLTASSAWSDELSLLAPGIIDVLQRACPDVKLRRLRFVVASGRTRLLFEAQRQRSHRSAPQSPVATDGSPASKEAFEEEDAAQAVARLAALQRKLNDDRDRAGWKKCTACGHRFFPDSPSTTSCAPCAESSRRRAQAVVERALMQAPWLREGDIVSTLPRATASVYERTRQRLLARWQIEIASSERRLRRGAPSAEDRVVAWSYLMLLTGLPQRDVGRAVVIDVLGQNWASVLFGDERMQKEEARRPSREKHK